MNLFDALKAAQARLIQMRAVKRAFLKLSAHKKRGAKRAFPRLSRARWIEESQKQGIEVANDRRAARERGDLRSHLVKFYPSHQHGHS